MTSETVTVRVPANPSYVALLRTAVGGFAARDEFTLDQVDDLRMAVEEAAVQVLRHIPSGDYLSLDVTTVAAGIEVRLHATVDVAESVIDEHSFSWTILRALADDVRVEMQQDHATVVLAKHRIVAVREGDSA